VSAILWMPMVTLSRVCSRPLTRCNWRFLMMTDLLSR